MPAPLPEKVGFGPCPNKYCKSSSPILFRLSSGARKLTWKCDRCDTSGYAEPHGGGYADMLDAVTEKLTAEAADTPAPAAVAAPAPKPKHAPEPTPKPPRAAPRGFNLGQLT